MAEEKNDSILGVKLPKNAARTMGVPLGGIVAATLAKGEQNKYFRRAALGVGSAEMAVNTTKDAAAYLKNGEYADFMMEVTNLFLVGMGVAEGNAEPVMTAATMRMMKEYSHGKSHEIEERFIQAKKARAKRIAGLPMIAHIHQKTGLHEHGDHDDHSDHDHPPAYAEDEIVDEASGLTLTAAEQKHLTGMLDHWRQFGAERVKEAFAAYQALQNNKQRTAHDIAVFEHQYGFIVLEGLKFNFHSQPFPQQGEAEARDKPPAKPVDNEKTKGTTLPQWKLIAKDYDTFRQRFDCLFYEVKRAERDIIRNKDNKITSDKPKENHGKVQHAQDFVECFAREIQDGDLVKVKPGQGVPVDGKLEKVGGRLGQTDMDTSLYTGDHQRKTVTGDPIFQMATNGQQELLMTATKKYKESSGFMLVHGDTKQKDTRASRETWLDKMLKKYVKWISLLGGLLFFKDALFEGEKGKMLDTKKLVSKENLRKSMEFFIVAAPCQIAASMMTLPALVERLKDEGKTHVLQRDHLLNMHHTHVVVFDMMQTLTEGHPSVLAVAEGHGDKRKLLAVARALEQGQKHPNAHAIRVYAAEELKQDHRHDSLVCEEAKNLRTGVHGKVEGRAAHIGNFDYFKTLAAETNSGIDQHAIDGMEQKLSEMHSSDEKAFKDEIFVWHAGKGNHKADWCMFSLQDKPREKAIDTLHALKKEGKEIVIATGSNKEKAEGVLRDMGVWGMVKLHANLEKGNPDEADLERRHGKGELTTKTDVVYDYIKQNKKVAMVGDGENDRQAMELVGKHGGAALGIQSPDSGLIQDKAGVMIRDIDDVYRLNKLSAELDKSLKRSVNFSMGWTGLLILAHLGEKKIKQWFGVELSTMTKGLLHEGPTAGQAIHAWNKAKNLAQAYAGSDYAVAPSAGR